MAQQQHKSNRRSFLKSSAMGALGVSSLLNSGISQAQQSSKRPFVTGKKDKKLVGCYASVKEIVDEPKYMDALQEQLGVNAIIMHTGIKMPDWLKEG